MYILLKSVSLHLKSTFSVPSISEQFLRQFPLYKYLYILSIFQSYIHIVLFVSLLFIVYLASSGHWGLSKVLYSP